MSTILHTPRGTTIRTSRPLSPEYASPPALASVLNLSPRVAPPLVPSTTIFSSSPAPPPVLPAIGSSQMHAHMRRVSIRDKWCCTYVGNQSFKRNALIKDKSASNSREAQHFSQAEHVPNR